MLGVCNHSLKIAQRVFMMVFFFLYVLIDDLVCDYILTLIQEGEFQRLRDSVRVCVLRASDYFFLFHFSFLP